MDSIIDLFNVVLKIAFFGSFLLLAINLVKNKKSSNSKLEIQNLQARLSKLRMSLKAKVKKKSNIFSASFKRTAVIEGDMIDNSLKALGDNSFETSEQFQKYFELSRKIVNFIQIETKVGSGEPENIENNFMCSDFKTEMDIVRIITEMSNISSRINKRVDDHNEVYPSKPLKKVDSLIFESMSDVNRIFKADVEPQADETDDNINKAS